MLSGIRVGKAKKKQQTNEGDTALASSSSKSHSKNEESSATNASAAQELKALLASGGLMTRKDHNRNESSSTVQEPPAAGIERKTSSSSSSAVVIGKPRKKTTGWAALLEDEQDNEEDSYYDKETRNILRNTKHKRKLVDTGDDDDAAFDQMQALRQDKPTSAKRPNHNNSTRQRQIARHDQITKLTSKCWWWLEAPTFDSHRLLAVGNAVSLVLAPSKLSLIPGQHFYLVPLAHVPSLTAADNDVWEETRKFQTSLRQLHQDHQESAEQKNTIVCYECVSPSHQKASFHQTRLEVVVVPTSVAEDIPLYFRSALTEHTSELHGTHTKLLNTTHKGLRNSIPSQMPYFYIEYYNPQLNSMAQIIEESFPTDFVVDTLASMMELEPIRFRSPSSSHQERDRIRSFQEKWKTYDWTQSKDK